MNTYYKDQLAKIQGNTVGFPAKINIRKNELSTNWLSLNDDSATALVEWLKENYNISEPENLDKFGSDWSILDIKECASINYTTDLSDDQARVIAANISRSHDATIGINWDVINDHIRMFIEDHK